MRGVLAMVLVVVAAGCAARNVYQQQSRQARRQAPREVRADPTPNLQLVELSVRVYADQDFRAHTPLWKDQLKTRFARINDYLMPSVGVRLVVDDLRQWERKADAADMEMMLWELQGLDPGDDAGWIVGFVAPSDSVTTSIHHIGLAHRPGKHFLLRGMDDAKQSQLIDKAYDQLTEKEKLRLYSSYKRHKELVVFLHEWAHTLGAMHVNDPEDFLYEHVTREQTAFAPPVLKYLRLAVMTRAPGAGDDERKVFLEYVRTMEFEHWDESLRGALAETLARRETTGAPDDGPVPAPILATVDDPAWEQATALTSAGAYGEAWKKLAELVELYPDQAAVQVLACQLAGHINQPKALAACDTAAALRPTDPGPRITKATTLTTAGRRKEALAAGADAKRLLDARGDQARRAHLHDLVAVYQTLYAVTLAEELAPKLSDDDARQVAAWALTTRRWVGFPEGMSATDEPDYADVVMRANELLDADTIPKVRKLVDGAWKRWPNAPGLLALRCAADAYDEQWKVAARSCDKAIAAYEDGFLARYWAAQTAMALGKKDAAAAHLERLITADPELHAAWELLQNIYTGAKLDDLRARHQKALGRPLN